MEPDPYAILGLARDADLAAVKRAFRTLARRLHPDVSREAEAKARFIEVRAAYDLLSDPARRAAYDRATAARAADDPAPPPRPSVRETFRATRNRFEGRVAGSRRIVVDALLSREEARYGARVPFRFPLGPRVLDIDIAIPPGRRRGDRLYYDAPLEDGFALTLVVHIDIA